MAKNTKNINIEVDLDVWKELKVTSIKEDLTMKEVVTRILEQALKK